MKRVFGLGLVLFLLLTLCACGNGGGNENGGENPGGEVHTHVFGAWTTVTESTCAVAGSQQRVCDCGETETQALALKAHTESDWIVDRQPSTTQDGHQYQKCTACGANLKEEIISKDTVGSQGLTYTVNDDGKSCTITGIGTCEDSNVVIPSVLDGYRVTAIEKRAFYQCTQMTEITIPASVENIGAQVFWKASNLHTVYYNSSYSNINNPFMNQASIKTVVFGGTTVPDHVLEDCNNVRSVRILDGVTSIEYGAFRGCSSLESIKISESVISIGWFAFDGCSNLSSVELPDSVSSIGSYAFRDCSSLRSIEIPDGVTGISPWTFDGCSSLTSVELPDRVTIIGYGAFNVCSDLKSIEIPGSVTKIDGCAFHGCSKLKSIRFDGTKEEWEVILKDEGEDIGYEDGWCSWDYLTENYTVYCTDGSIKK